MQWIRKTFVEKKNTETCKWFWHPYGPFALSLAFPIALPCLAFPIALLIARKNIQTTQTPPAAKDKPQAHGAGCCGKGGGGGGPCGPKVRKGAKPPRRSTLAPWGLSFAAGGVRVVCIFFQTASCQAAGGAFGDAFLD